MTDTEVKHCNWFKCCVAPITIACDAAAFGVVFAVAWGVVLPISIVGGVLCCPCLCCHANDMDNDSDSDTESCGNNTAIMMYSDNRDTCDECCGETLKCIQCSALSCLGYAWFLPNHYSSNDKLSMVNPMPEMNKFIGVDKIKSYIQKKNEKEMKRQIML